MIKNMFTILFALVSWIKYPLAFFFIIVILFNLLVFLILL